MAINDRAYPLFDMAREVQDHYFREAKREGYLSRAAYKLIEIDDRRKVLRPGDRVLDCGAAPGSWLQVAAARVGPRGLVVGIDLLPITHRFERGDIVTIEGDFTAFATHDLLARTGGRPAPSSLRSSGAAWAQFDVILSDMAPSTTGDWIVDHHRSVRLCESLLDRCGELLRPGGNLVMKVFEGEAYPALLARAKRMFAMAKAFKPKASRSESREIYIIAQEFQGDATRADDAAADRPLPKRKPSAGWGAGSAEGANAEGDDR